VEIAVRTLDHQSAFRQLRGATRPHEKGDVTASFEQTSAEVSADTPRSDDENSHSRFSLG
jgi:hypothetical protein